jgi:hypothetical protein
MIICSKVFRYKILTILYPSFTLNPKHCLTNKKQTDYIELPALAYNQLNLQHVWFMC